MRDDLPPRLRRLRPALTVAMALLALIATFGVANAQDRNRRDHRGREFRVAFLPTDGDAPAPTFMITVWCGKPTRGSVTYLEDPGSSFSIDIDVPYRPYTFRLDTTLLMLPSPLVRSVTRRTVLLRFEDEVTVYGINTMRWSSDAFTALPSDVMGTRYMILSYPNTQQPNPLGDRLGVSDFPSQFAVVATEDQTRVEVRPTTRFNGRAGRDPLVVMLNAGEVFLGQADGPAGADLTGTEVLSSRPVVVYGSHQRTNIPYQLSIGRDHLIEQLLPVDDWDQRFMLTPHFQLRKSVDDMNFARVLAAYDGTEVLLDSVPIATLRAGERLEIPLYRDRGQLVTANRPIAAAQYHNSSIDDRRDAQPNDSIGDPFYMLLASREQFDTSYVFQSYDTKDFRVHFINVVIPTERTGTIVFDGYRPVMQFRRIPKTSYSFAQLQVSGGGHTIRAAVPFGLYVYGFGPYNSYGYPGGFILDTLFKDHKEPRISVLDSCIGATGKAYDDSTTDFGMERVELLPTSRNVTLDAERPPAGSDSIHFRLNLVDPFFDGYAELKAVDTAGLDASAAVWVKGFTVAIAEGQLEPVVVDTLASLNGLAFCRRIEIVNYGRFEQTISRILTSTTDPSFVVRTAMPLTIAPGARAEIEVCFARAGDTSFAVELALDNGCVQRPIVVIPVISGVDTLPPTITTTSPECDPSVTLALREPGLFNSGVASIQYLVQRNYTPEVSPALPSKDTRLTLRRVDPRQDLVYDIVITDAVGLTRRIADTVQGFTLAAYEAPARQIAIRLDEAFEYDPVSLGDRRCDTILLVNYGLLPLEIVNPRMLRNLEFSIPPEQLPITLAPGERRGLAICASPNRVGQERDTFAVDFICGGVNETVEMRIEVQAFDLSSVDACGNPLTFAVNSVARRTFLEPPVPNPSIGTRAAITFGLTGPVNVSLGLFDLQGNEVRRFLDDRAMPGGLARIDAVVGDLPSGTYVLRLVTSGGETVTQKLVHHR